MNNLRLHVSYAYNRIISSVQGDISAKVLEDPALDELWQEAKEDEDYQKVAKGDGHHEDYEQPPHQGVQCLPGQVLSDQERGHKADAD